jgi:hypothetical protein
MVYFFHHYELPVIVQQAQLQQMFIRTTRNNNNNRQMDNGQASGSGLSGTNQQMNRENQQAQVRNEARGAGAAEAVEQPIVNNNNMFVIRGAYRRRVNHLVERLRNNFYNNVFGVGFIADNNNNNANNLRNQPGFNNLTRSLRLLNMIFPNRPILNVRIINVRSASAAATVADIIRNVEANGESPGHVDNVNSVSTEQQVTDSVHDDNNLERVFPTADEANARREESSSISDIRSSDSNMNDNDNVMQSAEAQKSNNDGEGSSHTSTATTASTTTTTTTSSTNEQ